MRSLPLINLFIFFISQVYFSFFIPVVISLNPSSEANYTSKKCRLSIRKNDLAKKMVSARKHQLKTKT